MRAARGLAKAAAAWVPRPRLPWSAEGRGAASTDLQSPDQNLKSTLTPRRLVKRYEPGLSTWSNGTATSAANSALRGGGRGQCERRLLFAG